MPCVALVKHLEVLFDCFKVAFSGAFIGALLVFMVSVWRLVISLLVFEDWCHYPADLIVLSMPEFLNEHLQFWVLYHFSQLVEASGARFDLILRVLILNVEQIDACWLVVWPAVLVMLQILLSCVDSSDGLEWLRKLIHFWVWETELKQVLTKTVCHSIKLRYFGEPLQESVRWS